MKKIFFAFIFFSFFLYSNDSRILARLGNVNVTFSEFQDYIDIQKFIFNKKNVNELLEEQRTTKNELLSRYLDQKILLINAKKNNINEKNKLVKNKYDNSYEQWISQIYTIKQVGVADRVVKESDLRRVYKKYNQKDQKPFNDLSKEEKSSLFRIVLLERFQEKKEEYQKKLEKKYKVVRNKINNQVIAVVGGKKISQNDLTEIIKKQLANFGITVEEAQEKDKKQYNQILNTARDELVFNALVELDMKKNKFLAEPIVMKSLSTYKDQIIVEVFVFTEIIAKATITDSELDNAFKEISRSRPQIKQLLPTQQEKVLRSFILQRKQPELLAGYLLEKKEEIIIKRNKDLLDKIT